VGVNPHGRLDGALIPDYFDGNPATTFPAGIRIELELRRKRFSFFAKF
jgi:hypothetical protein